MNGLKIETTRKKAKIMEEYLVKRTFDVMDMFDELGDGDKKEFLHEAIRSLDYDDGYEVTRNATAMLDDYQQCKLIAEVFGDVADEGLRAGIVLELIDKLPEEQCKKLIKYMEDV